MAGRWRTTTRGVETRHAGVATTTGKLVEELGQRGFSGCSMKGRVDDGRKRVHGRRSTLDARYASTFGLPHRLRSGGFATHLSRVVLTLAVAALAYVACPQATLADAVGVVRAQRDKLVAIVLTSFVASCCSAPPNRSPTPAPIGIVRYRHRQQVSLRRARAHTDLRRTHSAARAALVGTRRWKDHRGGNRDAGPAPARADWRVHRHASRGETRRGSSPGFAHAIERPGRCSGSLQGTRQHDAGAARESARRPTRVAL